MTTHRMNLQKSPFEKIRGGTKTIELRLNDEKRQQIKIGDEIEFSMRDNPEEKILTKVTNLLYYPTFKDLFQNLPPEATGSDSQEDWKLMYTFYSEEDEKKYGVVGIRLKLS